MGIIVLWYAVFAFCVITLIWSYGAYLPFFRSLKRFYKPIFKKRYFPFISIVIATYNEEEAIAEKLRNTLSLDYPKDKVEIIIVDSDSQDKTVQVAKRIAKDFQAIKIIEEESRQGKSHALNTSLKKVKGDIVLITDADCFALRKDTLIRLTENFADSSVGAVAAFPEFKSEGKSLIPRSFVRMGSLATYANLLDSIPTGFGEFLAFRRELVEKLDERCLSDDVDISTQVRKKGFRVVFEPEIQLVENLPREFKYWYKQMVRRKLNTFTTILHRKSMFFNPKYGWYGMLILPTAMLFPNLSPFLIIGSLVSLFAINPIYCFISTLIVVLLSVFSPLVRKFLVLQIVLLHAWFLYLFRRQKAAWEKEPHVLAKF